MSVIPTEKVTSPLIYDQNSSAPAEHPTGSCPEKATHHWHAAYTKTIVANRFSVKPTEAVKKVDAFSLELKPATPAGGFITLLVWAATTAYAVIIVQAYVTRPYVMKNEIEWSQGSGSFPLNMTCRTSSGCYISNKFDYLGVQLPDNSQQRCFKIEANQTFVVNVTYSQLSYDGLSVMYQHQDTNPELPAEYGFTVQSETKCWPDTDNPAKVCRQGIWLWHIAVGPGLTLANYVLTLNNSRSDQGQKRHEWFVNRVSEVRDVVARSSPCAAIVGVDNLASYAQSRIRLECFWNRITVYNEDTWISLWGTAGGAYSLCLQFGAMFLSTYNMYIWLLQWRRGRGTGAADQRDAPHPPAHRTNQVSPDAEQLPSSCPASALVGLQELPKHVAQLPSSEALLLSSGDHDAQSPAPHVESGAAGDAFARAGFRLAHLDHTSRPGAPIRH